MEIILVYVPCPNIKEAKYIAQELLSHKLCGCINIISKIDALFLWPPTTGKIDNAKESVLLIKTLPNKYTAIERMILKLHVYEKPCILKIKVDVNCAFHKWLQAELN